MEDRPEIFPLKTVHPLALVTLEEMAEDAAAVRLLFGYLREQGIEVPLVLEEPAAGTRHLSFLLHSDVLERQPAIPTLLGSLGRARAVGVQAPVALVRLFGPHFDIRPGLAAHLFAALERAEVDLLGASTTGTSTLLVVAEDHLERVLRALGRSFRRPGGT